MSDNSIQGIRSNKNLDQDDNTATVNRHGIAGHIRPILSMILHDRLLLIGSIILVAIPVFVVAAFILSIAMVMKHLF